MGHQTRVGLGCMRLSTDRDRDEARGIAVVHAALDAGVTFFDTADAYAWDDGEAGHNERLLARALATWRGDRSGVLVATKGGLTRPGGRWAADGRASHLAAACEASCRALGVNRIPLYQLHAVDPRTPLATSVRCLAGLKRDGLVERIGLCNVNVGQLDEARRIADIDSVQVELSVWNDDHLLSGVAAYCIEHRLRLIAYRPLGGPQRLRRIAAEDTLRQIAARHDATPFDIALAWLLDLSELIVPIPGATRVETAASLGRAGRIAFSDDDRAALDRRFPSGALVRPSVHVPAPATARTDGEIVMIMGLPAAGKSTAARAFVDRGYVRLNRDAGGGTLRSLLPAIDRLIEEGRSRIVLDNTYVSRKSRGALIQAAAKTGLPVRCVWLSTSLEDAQINAVSRMIGKYGRLLGPEEIRTMVKTDVNAFGPGVQFRYVRELEPPSPDEGFSRIDTIPFARVRDPSFTNRAVIVWCDGVLGTFRGAEGASLALFEGAIAALRRWASDGWLLLGLDWQPDLADATVTLGQVEARYERLRAALGVSIDVRYCPHAGGPPKCWCRKPLPGLPVALIEQYRLDPSRCLYVGAGSQDPGFARRVGFHYREAGEFFREQ